MADRDYRVDTDTAIKRAMVALDLAWHMTERDGTPTDADYRARCLSLGHAYRTIETTKHGKSNA